MSLSNKMINTVCEPKNIDGITWIFHLVKWLILLWEIFFSRWYLTAKYWMCFRRGGLFIIANWVPPSLCSLTGTWTTLQQSPAPQVFCWTYGKLVTKLTQTWSLWRPHWKRWAKVRCWSSWRRTGIVDWSRKTREQARPPTPPNPCRCRDENKNTCLWICTPQHKTQAHWAFWFLHMHCITSASFSPAP